MGKFKEKTIENMNELDDAIKELEVKTKELECTELEEEIDVNKIEEVFKAIFRGLIAVIGK